MFGNNGLNPYDNVVICRKQIATGYQQQFLAFRISCNSSALCCNAMHHSNSQDHCQNNPGTLKVILYCKA